MQISIPVLLVCAAGLIGLGIAIGWNNGKKATIAKIEAEAKTLVGDALAHVSAFWTKIKTKL